MHFCNNYKPQAFPARQWPSGAPATPWLCRVASHNCRVPPVGYAVEYLATLGHCTARVSIASTTVCCAAAAPWRLPPQNYAPTALFPNTTFPASRKFPPAMPSFFAQRTFFLQYSTHCTKHIPATTANTSTLSMGSRPIQGRHHPFSAAVHCRTTNIAHTAAA